MQPPTINFTPLIYIGVIILGLGIFLALAGFDIVKVEKVSVKPGRTTWMLGLVFIVVGFVALLSGGILTSPGDIGSTPRGESTHTPTVAAPTATITPPAPAGTPELSRDQRLRLLLAEAKGWQKVMEDGFGSNANQWPIENTDDVFTTGTFAVKNGVLAWDLNAKKPGGGFYRIVAPVDAPSDFYYSVRIRRTAKTLEGKSSPLWGLFFRRHGSDGYGFWINDSREYSLHMKKGQEWTTLIDRTFNADVRLDEFNTLAVIAQGPRMSFFINNEPVGEIEDSTFVDGNVCFGVNVYDTDIPVGLEFDDFELRAAP